MWRFVAVNIVAGFLQVTTLLKPQEAFFTFKVITEYTGLFISPSGISKIDCATTKTDTAERSRSMDRESL